MKDLNKKVQREKEVIAGNATKDKTYSSQREFQDEGTAQKEFSRSVEKLFQVNRWSDLPGISSTFQLYSPEGVALPAGKPKVGDYIKILLPGPVPENWVIVTHVQQQNDMAEFTSSPSIDPTAKGKDREEIKHFFIDEAKSTFRVTRQGNTIYAYEIGVNEGINNQGDDAGNRKLINTLVSEGGWAGFQAYQWKKITDYLVHEIEVDSDNA